MILSFSLALRRVTSSTSALHDFSEPQSRCVWYVLAELELQTYTMSLSPGTGGSSLAQPKNKIAMNNETDNIFNLILLFITIL